MKKHHALSDYLLHSFLVILFLSSAIKINAKDKEENLILLRNAWIIQSSETVKEKGDVISSPSYKAQKWYASEVPSTILGTLVKQNVYKDVFNGMNLKSISREQFKCSWWYRKEFSIPSGCSFNSAILQFDGIIYRANVWINGIKIASSDTTEGVYRRFNFDISRIINKNGLNVLAVEVFPPQKGEPSVGFVDWNPKPNDNSMGLWRDVRVKLCGDVSIENPYIRSKVNLETLKSAELTISAELKNYSNEKVNGVLEGQIENIKFAKEISLGAKEEKLVVFSPQDFSQLKINNPRLWWCLNYGNPELYTLKLNYKVKDKTSDISLTRFGIREISDYLNDQGHRGYKLNGKKILIRGGGWVDDIFLSYDHKKLASQIQYVKHMGLNTIRLEGFWGSNQDMFDLCDENGIMMLAGYSCQWEWENSMGKKHDAHGCIYTPEDMKLVAISWKDQIKWLRNHPSIFTWNYGSDKWPRPELEKEYVKILAAEDPSRPFLASTHQGKSEVTGRTAVKMYGPYDYVPPVYWTTDKKNGGAFGFNTETGPGAQVPPLETIKKMIPENHLWPIDSVWNYHCGGNDFNSLRTFSDALNNRLGAPENVNEYCMKAQMINYDGVRAMFEAFGANKHNATGVIQWMLNASWPKLWWQLYDYYLMPNGAFYGAKKACEPLHIQYNYAYNSIIAVNSTLKEYAGLKAHVDVLNFDLSKAFTRDMDISLKADESQKLFMLPGNSNLSKTYFVDLKLNNEKGETLSRNFYALSTKEDVLDTAKTNWYITPVKSHGDLTLLNTLKKVKLNIEKKIKNTGGRMEFEVVLKNPSNSLAYLIEVAFLKGKDGQTVLPIFLDDNYFSILPGENKVIKGYFEKAELDGKKPELKISGWNVID